MRSSTLALSTASAVIVATLAAWALAAPLAPPSGWEIAPTVKRLPKPKTPACCGADATCCERQMAVDGAVPRFLADSVDVELSSIPTATVLDAKDGGPGVEGAPAFRYIDGHGTPFPWKDGPKGEIRALPPGAIGVMKIGAQGWLVPHFENPELRGMGYGDVRTIDGAGHWDLSGPYAFTAIRRGEGGRILVDKVEGKLDATLQADARHWMHVEAVPVFRATLFAYREPTKDGERLHVVVPDSARRIESLGVDVEGTDIPSRFARRWPYGDFSFPVRADFGKIAVFEIGEDAVRHFRDVGAKPDKDWDGRILLDLNGTEGGTFVLRIRRAP